MSKSVKSFNVTEVICSSFFCYICPIICHFSSIIDLSSIVEGFFFLPTLVSLVLVLVLYHIAHSWSCLNNRDYDIDQNKCNYDFCHNQGALIKNHIFFCLKTVVKSISLLISLTRLRTTCIQEHLVLLPENKRPLYQPPWRWSKSPRRTDRWWSCWPPFDSEEHPEKPDGGRTKGPWNKTTDWMRNSRLWKSSVRRTFDPDRAMVPRLATSSSWFIPTPVSYKSERKNIDQYILHYN